ncbi:THAP domain-containing protein 2-like [Solenopsis invicta]|uniref:THAP domain-containing protein 2-like n=1 Tax=Solenopsis invicta TaxID=13686 RepID=UPI00193E8A4B|nr:THAP domain-containing protein 2-like [Solenopsis invicta]
MAYVTFVQPRLRSNHFGAKKYGCSRHVMTHGLLLFKFCVLCAVTMSACAVKGCNNSYQKRIIIEGKPVKYFRFPKDNAIAVKWREVCKNGVNMTYGRICSKHFDASCYDKPAQHIALNYSPLRGRKLRLDAIPTLHLFSELHVVKRLDACAKDVPKTISDCITETTPSTTTLKIISESIAETKPSSTAQPVILDSIEGDTITTVTTADYSTLV